MKAVGHSFAIYSCVVDKWDVAVVVGVLCMSEVES